MEGDRGKYACLSEAPQADSKASTMSNPFSWMEKELTLTLIDRAPKGSPAGSASLSP